MGWRCWITLAEGCVGGAVLGVDLLLFFFLAFFLSTSSLWGCPRLEQVWFFFLLLYVVSVFMLDDSFHDSIS